MQPLLPTPDPLLKEHAIAEALYVYRMQQAEKHTSHSIGGLFHIKPYLAGACAMLAIVVAFKMYPAQQSVHTGTSQAMVLSELQKTFGNQLEGVIKHKANYEPLISAQKDQFSNGQPIVIVMKDGDKETRIITNSGNTLQLQMGDKNITISPSVTASGKVIVEGDNFLWKDGKTVGEAPYSIEAKPLGQDL